MHFGLLNPADASNIVLYDLFAVATECLHQKKEKEEDIFHLDQLELVERETEKLFNKKTNFRRRRR